MNIPFRSVSLVVPVFNEQGNLAGLVQRCLKVGKSFGCDFELILVDDGSTDSSPSIIRSSADHSEGQVVGILLNRNYGQHAAVMAGFAQARGDVIVTLDADLQNPPEEIPKLLAAISAGHDVVGGVRRVRRDSALRRLASRMMNDLMRRITGVAITDYGCMLRAYRRDVVDAVLACHERSPYVPALANSFAGHVAEVLVEHEERQAGESKYALWSLINLYFDLLVSATTRPLRLLSTVGAGLAVSGLGFGVLLLILRLIYGAAWAAEGVFTIFAALFVFLGAQFIGMGLLGEYIGRISRDVQGRPRYVVHEVVGAALPRVAGEGKADVIPGTQELAP